jgi:hypothetical protein
MRGWRMRHGAAAADPVPGRSAEAGRSAERRAAGPVGPPGTGRHQTLRPRRPRTARWLGRAPRRTGSHRRVDERGGTLSRRWLRPATPPLASSSSRLRANGVAIAAARPPAGRTSTGATVAGCRPPVGARGVVRRRVHHQRQHVAGGRRADEAASVVTWRAGPAPSRCWAMGDGYGRDGLAVGRDLGGHRAAAGQRGTTRTGRTGLAIGTDAHGRLLAGTATP